jgi:hypothetical protein
MIISEFKTWIATNLAMLLAVVSAALLVVVVIAFFWIRALHAEAETLKGNFDACQAVNKNFAAAADLQTKAVDAMQLSAIEAASNARRAGDAQRALADGIRALQQSQPIAPLAPGADACVAARALVDKYLASRGAK